MKKRKSEDYWEKAALQRAIAAQEGAETTAQEVLAMYDDALDDINDEIRKIEYNYRKRFGIDERTAAYFLEEAQRNENLQRLIVALENAPDEAARMRILDFIHSDGLSTRAYSARIERFNAVKESIYARIKKLAVEETLAVKAILKKTFSQSYYGVIDDTAKELDVGIGFGILNDRAIEEAVSVKWKGRTFSQRIWKRTDELSERAQEITVRYLMSGRSLDKAAAELSQEFAVSKYHATMLIHTETAHIQNKADLKAYEDLGIEEYKYLATLDYVTCPTCQALDNRVFKRSEAKEGVNYPVMHPNCRCTTTMNIKYSNRRARVSDKSGNVLVDGDLTYSEWVASLTPEQKQVMETARRKNERRVADKAQYAQYKHVLGTKVVSGGFDKFQDIKYNDKETWEFMKLDYKRQHHVKMWKDYTKQIKKGELAGDALKDAKEWLRDNPVTLLPNAKKATADDRKFTEYLFGGNHKEGLAKGKAFTRRLGYDIDNYAELKAEILSKADRYPVSLKNDDIHGRGYEQKMVLYGAKSNEKKKTLPANVIVGWKEKDGKTWLTSVYIKEVK